MRHCYLIGMSFEPYSILIILLFSMGLFIWGRWRYDVVALIALAVSVAVGAVPFEHIYSGLSNSAVITVACVMVISQAITNSGVLNPFVRKINTFTGNPVIHIGILTLTTAVFSAFMNNVGALALMMPIAIQSAIKANRSPSMVLMPIALGSALGGLTTLIGTPPNLLISAYRQEFTGHPFALFDYSYVGLPVAIVGVILLATFLWRLIPGDRQAPKKTEDMFHVQDYITEVKVMPESPLIDISVSEFERTSELDFILIGLVRNKKKRLQLPPDQLFKEDDILILEAGTEELQELVQRNKLELVGGKELSPEILKSDDVSFIEAVVPQGSRIEGRSSISMRLRTRHHLNLLAVSRSGKAFKERLNHLTLEAGDVVLLQGPSDGLNENVANLGFLPLVERGVHVGTKRKVLLPIFIFILAIILAAFQLLPVQVAFGGAVLGMILFKVIPVRKLYESIDWSIIILLAAMIPIGGALQSTGGTAIIAHYFIAMSGHISPIFILGLLLLVTMTLSDFMNNAATTVVMAPIAVGIAQALKVNIDPFLMTVALGASCSFLTPVGHQNNTLVMGPGGYKFSDYIRLGLPLEILVIMVGFPAILWAWPM